MAFLSAAWSNLFLVTYAVPSAELKPHLAPGLELDCLDGQAFVSLVAFQFVDTRVLGISWPGYRNFAELNLRFYVRHGADRGVMFVREFVPLRLVAWIARWFYNEPYVVAPFRAHIEDKPDCLDVDYRLERGGRVHVLQARGRKPAYLPDEGSTEHFFKEHCWGFGRTRRGHGLRYEVAHPAWSIYPIQSCKIDLDWALVYGPEWAFLQNAVPYSTILAAGSPVLVYSKGRLQTQPQPVLCQIDLPGTSM